MAARLTDYTRLSLHITMTSTRYRGRFAPTPSGDLHFGSIIAALGSFLQARNQQGSWLVRIDDVDKTRARPGADTRILRQLENLGLHWDGDIMYQSQRDRFYQSALDSLDQKNLLYACQCSRKQVGQLPYPGTCREAALEFSPGCALRVKTNNAEITITDKLQGNISSQLQHEFGDFIVRRADDLFAYHLAVVVDDAELEVTEVVRGADLLDTTAAQVYLQQLLHFDTPHYLHLPVALDQQGKKLSKSGQAVAVTGQPAQVLIIKALSFLGQVLPDHVHDADRDELLAWAIEHWDTSLIPRRTTITL